MTSEHLDIVIIGSGFGPIGRMTICRLVGWAKVWLEQDGNLSYGSARGV